jgi:hypothetical protein
LAESCDTIFGRYVSRDQALAHHGLPDLCQHTLVTLVIVEGGLLQTYIMFVAVGRVDFAKVAEELYRVSRSAGMRPLPVMDSTTYASTPLS